MLRRITIQCSLIFPLMIISFSILAHNKVVVIPMFGDEIGQCVAKTNCNLGEMTLTCPSGDMLIQCDISNTSFSKPDPIDVGMPSEITSISGFDIIGVEFIYNSNNDILSVNIDFFGIAGDADGDGDPGVSSPELLNNGGTDLPNLEGTEHIYAVLDLNLDGLFDLIVGVPMDAGIQQSQNLKFANYTGNGTSAGSNDFGTLGVNGVAQLNELPSIANPDFNFTISNWSNIAIDNTTSLIGDPNKFDFQVYSGSFQDDGIGQDSLLGSAELVP